MPSFNSLVFVGHCTKDIELRDVGSTKLATWGMASNRKYKTSSGEQREEVCFIDCKCFGNAAGVLSQYVRKGDPLLVQGRVAYETWEAKDGSGKRSKHVIIVENFQFLGGKQQDRQDDAPPQRQQRSPGHRPAPPSNEPPYGEETQFQEDDIPF